MTTLKFKADDEWIDLGENWVKKAGDTMTGNLTLEGEELGITFRNVFVPDYMNGSRKEVSIYVDSFEAVRESDKGGLPYPAEAFVVHSERALKENEHLMYLSTEGDVYFHNKKIWEYIYPVGAIYLSYNSTSPADLFGGKWTQITGRFIRAANNVNTGGSDTITHQHLQTMGIDPNNGELYALNSVDANKLSGEFNGITQSFNGGTAVFGKNFNKFTRNNFTSGAGRTDATAVASTDNRPAYQSLYVWRRTS